MVSTVLDMELSVDPLLSVVPQTLGTNNNSTKSTCLVIFFSDGDREKRAKAFIKEMQHTKVCRT